jgi:hypothetical protein
MTPWFCGKVSIMKSCGSTHDLARLLWTLRGASARSEEPKTSMERPRQLPTNVALQLMFQRELTRRQFFEGVGRTTTRGAVFVAGAATLLEACGGQPSNPKDYLHNDTFADMMQEKPTVTPGELYDNAAKYAEQLLTMQYIVAKVLHKAKPVGIEGFVPVIQFLAFTRDNEGKAVLINDDDDRYISADTNIDCCTVSRHNHMEKGDHNIGEQEEYQWVTGRWLPTTGYPIEGIKPQEYPYAFWVGSANSQ